MPLPAPSLRGREGGQTLGKAVWAQTAARAASTRLTRRCHALWSPHGTPASQTSASVLMDSFILWKCTYLTGKFISTPNVALINKHNKSKTAPLNLGFIPGAFSVKNWDLQE